MVFLAAALYTVYQQALKEQEEEAKRSTTTTATQERSTETSPSKSDHWQNLGQSVYTNAVLRCTPRDFSTQTVKTTAYNSSAESDNNNMERLTCAPQPSDESGNHNDLFDQQKQPTEPLTPVLTNIFSDTVREEWWNAVMGEDFLRDDVPVRPPVPRQTVGLAARGEAQSMQVVVEASEEEEDPKLGLTIHRLPLGLYVRSVMEGSEAELLGVPEEAVLVAVNGLCLLAEPSRAALERLWQYEGWGKNTPGLEGGSTISGTTWTAEASSKTPSAASTSKGSDDDERPDPTLRAPTSLEFIHQGQLFSVLFLSNPPWGISWAPCGNFPLIQRVYRHAATAGVPKGALLTAVNETSCRLLDHAATAAELRGQRKVRLTLSFPPPTARPGRRSTIDGKKSPTPNKKTVDGVEITFHPLLCSSTTSATKPKASNSNPAACWSGEEGLVRNELIFLAEQVSAGTLEAPFLHKPLSIPKDAYFPLCPALKEDTLMEEWEPFSALVYCLGLAHARYDSRQYIPLSGTATSADHLERLRSITTNDPQAPQLAYYYLMSFLSLICSPNTAHANELTSLLLKLSRRDEFFCQSLYFLLRSYISTFEKRRPSTASDRNLMALLHCLELLRFAEKELAHVTLGETTVAMLADEGGAPTPMAASPGSPESTEHVPPPEPIPRKRSVLGLFRRRSKKAGKGKSQQQSTQISPVQHAPVTQHSISTSTSPVEAVLPSVPSGLSQSPSTLYENMSDFLSELDRICGTIERSLQKSFRQKIKEWALQPWTASKDSALAQVTGTMRASLLQTSGQSSLLVNPVESAEVLSSVDHQGCYILPSAHFPILLTFNVSDRRRTPLSSNSIQKEERIFSTTIELESLRPLQPDVTDEVFCVHGAIAGSICESGESTFEHSQHNWTRRSTLEFETRSTWGAPKTLSLRVASYSSTDQQRQAPVEVGFGWVDLTEQWEVQDALRYYKVTIWPLHEEPVFDDNGEWVPDAENAASELTIKVTTNNLSMNDPSRQKKRMLLYKHDDDLRQEAFAVQFIKTCDEILKASGLDMRLLTFQCVPVGTRRGFVEWVPGSVPLSEICQPFSSFLSSDNSTARSALEASNADDDDDSNSPSMVAKAGLTKFESLRRLQVPPSSMRSTRTASSAASLGARRGNPIQEFLRSVAYDAGAPYLINKNVMDTYIKSCAGYSVITYLLGVGDRHLDNLLLHPTGSFFHCDYSFILGSDPKKYLPLRITQDMIDGMGGQDSDNYQLFLSLVGGAFVTLRRPEYVRVILSLVRIVEASWLPDVSENQTIGQALHGVRDRLRLDLTDNQALSFMEELIESSLSNRMWMAVDAIHSLGKRIQIS